MNLEGVLPMVRGKVKNETVATFYDVCDVFNPNYGPFFNFPSGLKVIDLFKAKMEVFRERNCEKWKRNPFSHFESLKSLRDEIRFLMKIILKPCANSDPN